MRKAAEEYQKFALELIEEAKEVDDKNYVAFGGKKGMKDERTRQYTNIVALPVLKFYQWREIASGPYNIDGYRAPAGIYYYGAKELDRWLGGHAMQYVAQLRGEIAALEKDLPPMYPFLHSMKEGPETGRCSSGDSRRRRHSGRSWRRADSCRRCAMVNRRHSPRGAGVWNWQRRLHPPRTRSPRG